MQPANTIPFKKFIPAIAWFIIVCFVLFLPGHDIPDVDWLERINFDKLVHMSMFALMVTLFSWPINKSYFTPEKRKKYFLTIWILFCLWGYCSELIQKYWCIGRDYDILDWTADGLGATIGYFIARKRFMSTTAEIQ